MPPPVLSCRSITGSSATAFSTWLRRGTGVGAVGHPNEGGGPGYPTVGQYASQVMAIYAQLGGTGGGTPTTPVQSGGYVAATLLELLLALNQEATQRGIGDAHSREQALAE